MPRSDRAGGGTPLSPAAAPSRLRRKNQFKAAFHSANRAGLGACSSR